MELHFIHAIPLFNDNVIKMAAVCTMHLLYLPVASNVDIEATVKYIYTMLLEIFSMTDDNVVIAIDQSPIDHSLAVSLTYDNAWRRTICWNNDSAQIKSETAHWCNTYGSDLSHEAKCEILTCDCRLDIRCDPDTECYYDREVRELTEFLRLSFTSNHLFDPENKALIRGSV